MRPAVAAKLSWKETSRTTVGCSPAITAAGDQQRHEAAVRPAQKRRESGKPAHDRRPHKARRGAGEQHVAGDGRERQQRGPAPSDEPGEGADDESRQQRHVVAGERDDVDVLVAFRSSFRSCGSAERSPSRMPCASDACGSGSASASADEGRAAGDGRPQTRVSLPVAVDCHCRIVGDGVDALMRQVCR